MDSSSLSPLTPPHYKLNASLSSPLPHSPSHQYSPRRRILSHSPSLPPVLPVPPHRDPPTPFGLRGLSLDYSPSYDTDGPSITRGTGVSQRRPCISIPSHQPIQDNNNSLCRSLVRQDAISDHQQNRQKVFASTSQTHHSFPPLLTDLNELSYEEHAMNHKSENESLLLRLPLEWSHLDVSELLGRLLETLHTSAPHLTHERVMETGLQLGDASGLKIHLEVVPNSLRTTVLEMKRLSGNELQYTNLCERLIACFSA